MLEVKRIGHVTLVTPDVARQTDYYRNVLGLSVVHETATSAVLATKMGQEVLVLAKGDQPGCPTLSYQVAPGADLKALAAALQREGVASEIRSDVTPNIKSVLTFKDPNGARLEIFDACTLADEDLSPSAIIPRKLGHVAFNTAEVGKLVDFYKTMLGFRVSDSREDWFVFMRCGRDHHTANFIQTGKTDLHHLAFELRDEAEINRACDHIARMGMKLYWGPVRHIIGHNIAIYHHNPDGVAIELFCDLDVMIDESLGYFEMRPWHQDRPQRPKVWPNDTGTNSWGWERLHAPPPSSPGR